LGVGSVTCLPCNSTSSMFTAPIINILPICRQGEIFILKWPKKMDQLLLVGIRHASFTNFFKWLCNVHDMNGGGSVQTDQNDETVLCKYILCKLSQPTLHLQRH
jgi:hypothetical protein